jgi:hypothetical protein
MTEEKREQERADRNRERSEEAHWRVAEAGAAEEERLSEEPKPTTKQHDKKPIRKRDGAQPG